MPGTQKVKDPTPQELRKARDMIKQSWDQKTRRNRWFGPRSEPMTVPVVRTRELGEPDE